MRASFPRKALTSSSPTSRRLPSALKVARSRRRSSSCSTPPPRASSASCGAASARPQEALDLRARAARSACWSGRRSRRPTASSSSATSAVHCSSRTTRLTARASAPFPASSTPSGSRPATARRLLADGSVWKRTAGSFLQFAGSSRAWASTDYRGPADSRRGRRHARRRRRGLARRESSRDWPPSSASPSASSSWARSPTTPAWRTGTRPPTSSFCRRPLTRASAWRRSRRSQAARPSWDGDRRDARAPRAARPAARRQSADPEALAAAIASALDFAATPRFAARCRA